ISITPGTSESKTRARRRRPSAPGHRAGIEYTSVREPSDVLPFSGGILSPSWTKPPFTSPTTSRHDLSLHSSMLFRSGGRMTLVGHGECMVSFCEKPRRNEHGTAAVIRCLVATHRAALAPAEAQTVPLPRPQAAGAPPGTHGHPLRPAHRHPLERPALRNGLWLGQRLPQTAARVAADGHLG